MSQNESDQYFWTPKSGKTIDAFLKTTRPALITNDQTPWIWVQGSDGPSRNPERDGDEAKSKALIEAERILKDLEKRLIGVEKDDSIPVRASKGKKSKKAVRDEMLEEAKKDLKELSIKSKWTCGKWLLFPRHSEVDGTWAKVAESVASGPLKGAGVFQAKVAPTPESLGDGEQPTHVICLYMLDVYDLKLVRGVLEILLTKHGLEPSACKSDLYTLAGIDSNHPTKLRSTLWRPNEVIEGGVEAVKALRAQYNKPSRGDGHRLEDGMIVIESDSDDEKAHSAKRKGTAQDDPAQRSAPESSKARQPFKKAKSAAMKYQDQNIFGGGSDSD